MRFIAESETLQLSAERRALQSLRLQERLHELAVAQDEIRQRASLSGELLRIFERALEDEPGDRVDIDRRDFASKAHRFERDRAAAGERIEHARDASAVGFADFVAEKLQVGVGFASPMEDAADGLLALDFDALAGDVFLFDFRDDAPADALDEPAPLFGVAGIGQQRRDQRRAARG